MSPGRRGAPRAAGRAREDRNPQSRPQLVVRVPRLLRLQGDEVLDGGSIGRSTRSRRNWRASSARLSARRLRTGSGISRVYGTVWTPAPVTMVGTASAAPTPRGTVDQTGLVERASQGDHEAFGVLVGAHLARLDTAARLILRDPELARDAVQEATLRAWKNLRGLRDPDRFDAWLHRLTVNACLDLARRRRGRVFEVELTPLHDAPVPDAASGCRCDVRRTNARSRRPAPAGGRRPALLPRSRCPRRPQRWASRSGPPSPA